MADKELTRLDFFKEIKKDLTEAAKEFIIPIVADDIDKLDDVVDEVIGVEWFYLNNAELEEGFKFEGVKDLYINNRHIAIFFDGDNLQAVEKACPNCNGILNWVANGNKFKCKIITYDQIALALDHEEVNLTSIKNIILRLRKKLPTDIFSNMMGVGYRVVC